MRKRFFLSHFSRALSATLIPLFLFSVFYLLMTIPEQRRESQGYALNNLTLMEENISLLLNDTSKVLALMESTSNATSVRRLFRFEELAWREYTTYKNLSSQLAAIVNSRTYIDSIYLYVKNERGTYLSSDGRLYNAKTSPDPLWIETCKSEDSFRIVRRSVSLTSLPQKTEYLTIVDENERGVLVAVNINISYFQRIFSSLALKPEQLLMVASGSRLLLSNSSRAQTLFDSLAPLTERETVHEQQGHLIVHIASEIPGLTFISALPVGVAYAAINRFSRLFLTALMLCMTVSLISALVHASRTARRLYSIIDLMDAASHNRPLPEIQNPRDDIYGYIMTNLVKTFVQNDFLKVSLDERKYQSISLELSALQYQINPHFLSNTLQAIDFEVLRAVGKPHHANQMIEHLSEFLQYSLKSPNQDVSMDRELEATKLYASLMQMRFGDGISFSWDVDPAVLCVSTPKLILQPIIENSIQHGREGHCGVLNTSVVIRLADNMLHISVSNNGPGVSPEKLEEIRSRLTRFEGFQERHIGLPNLFRRLQLHYGENCRAEIESPPEGGFTVNLFLPAS